MRLLFFLFLCTLLMAVTEACCPGCPRTSDKGLAGLSRHQSSCKIYKKFKQNSTARRKARLASQVAPKIAPSPRRAAANIRSPSASRSTPSLPIPSRPTTPLPPPVTQSGRPGRNYRMPARFEDVLPEPPAPIDVAPAPAENPRRVILYVWDTMRSACNRFGLLREYQQRPSYDPDSLLKPEDLANIPPPPFQKPPADTPTSSPLAPWPFRNMSIYRLMHWANSGSNAKSEGEVTRLVKERSRRFQRTSREQSARQVGHYEAWRHTLGEGRLD
ncbi:hypothetical protein B0H19DRAFT_1082450 [Mycena capillaripes]|nr:hypothetical protein B0H19DRAFT_1082450 [Mycena capillaripes]